MRRRTLLAMAVVAAIIAMSQAQQEPVCSYRPRATEPCMHNSECTEGNVCVCREGLESYTCGFVHGDCSCPACLHGNATNADQQDGNESLHTCLCESGWVGYQCDICTQSSSCGVLYPDNVDPICDVSQVVISKKTFDCNITDEIFQSLFPDPRAMITVWAQGLDAGNGTGFFHVLARDGTVQNLREVFYCRIDACTMTGNEEEIEYICAETQCYYTDHVYASDSLVRIIEGFSGRCSLLCPKPDATSGLMGCELRQEGLENFIDKISVTCRAGECTSEERPIVVQPVNVRAIVAAVILCVVLIALVLLSMYMYRRHQAKYLNFKDEYGQTISFVELTDQHAFGDDTLVYRHIEYELDNKLVLFGLAGIAKPGEVTAIIGASGAGKTTLLDILAMRSKRGKVSGEVLLNGAKLGTAFQRVTAYVDQEPSVIGTQTVREILLTAARLRLPEVVTYAEKVERIQSLAKELGVDHILDRRYGDSGHRGISGGEKRRVQIACQLITGPSVIFLDEPTSGLDSSNALTVCRFLKSYAQRKNRTIVMAIHQPRADILATFDRLVVLALGRTIFDGPAAQATEYFEKLGYRCPPDMNVADFILDVTMMEREVIPHLASAYSISTFHEAKAADIQAVLARAEGEAEVLVSPPLDVARAGLDGYSAVPQGVPAKAPPSLNGDKYKGIDSFSDRYATSFWTQLVVLSGRSFSDMYRNPLLLRLHLAFSVLSGLVIGLVFFNLTLDFAGTQNRIGMLLFVLIVLAFSAMSSIGFMSRERDVFVQERASGSYRPAAYFVVKVLFDTLPLRAIPAIVTCLLVYFLTGMQSDPVLLAHFILVIVLFSMTTALICIAIAACIANPSLANLVAIITLLFMTLCQGAMMNLSTLPSYIAWVTYMSPFRFAYNSIMVNEFDGLTILFDPYGVEPELITGRMVLTTFGFFPSWAYSIDLYALSAMLVFWFLVGMAAIQVLVKERR